MTHKFDRRVHDVEREKVADRQVHWHKQINRELEKAGLRKEGNMNRAIVIAHKHKLIDEQTVALAHDVRMKGNAAKHNFYK